MKTKQLTLIISMLLLSIIGFSQKPIFTTNQIPRFTDGLGTLGNSMIFQYTSSSPDRIGIGTSTPASVFHVNATTNYSIARFANTKGGADVEIYGSTSYAMIRNRASSAALILYANNNYNQLYLSSNGNVGIGTNSPGAELDVYSSSASLAIFRNSSAGGKVEIYGGYNEAIFRALNYGKGLEFATYNSDQTYNSHQLYLKSNGNVGVGTNSPTAKLEVNGDLNINGKTEYSYGPFTGSYIPLSVYTNSNITNNQKMIVMRSEGISSTPQLKRVGISFQLSGDDDLNENSKMGAITLESELTWSNNPSLNIWTNNEKRLSILSDGNIGIGTASPSTKLEINNGVLKISGSDDLNQGDARLIIDTETTSNHSFIQCKNLAGNQFVVTNTGKVYAREVEVLANIIWPDYVFEDDYKLLPLDELSTYIFSNKHLPNIPSADEIEKNGINLGEMDNLLLRKIEELTLYTIEQQKLLEELQNEIDILKNE